jgi:hypothetical protein
MGHAPLPSIFYNLLELVCELYFLLRKNENYLKNRVFKLSLRFLFEQRKIEKFQRIQILYKIFICGSLDN